MNDAGLCFAEVATFHSIPNGVRIPGMTSHSNIFEPDMLTITLYRSHDVSDPRVVHLVDALAEGRRVEQRLDQFSESP